MKLPLSVTFITYNEEKQLPQALQSVSWADEIIVVDSGSTDRTCEIATQWGAQVFHRTWEGYGSQKNFAQQQAHHAWVLNLDADERLSSALTLEIQQILSTNTLEFHGFAIPRKTFYLGKWIRYGGWYPNYLVRLVHQHFAVWTEPHVHEELQVTGKVAYLKAAIEHYPFKNIQDQVLTNLKFSKLGSQDLEFKGQKPSLLKLIFKPIGKFIETYFFKKGFLDGTVGFIISINAAHSMFLKYAYLIENKTHYEDSCY